MLRSYLKTALRFFRRQRGYALLNVLGLSVGLACSFLILLWVQDELRYDRFHEDGDRLFSVMRNVTFSNGDVFTWNAIPKPLADVLEADYPEVENTVLMTWRQNLAVNYDDQAFYEHGYSASPGFFAAFTFPFALGDPATALNDPSSVVVSESLAEKYFGPNWRTQDVLGRTFRIGDGEVYSLTGVFADVPETSTLQFDLVLPISGFIARNEWVEHWGNSGLRLHVRLRPDADAAVVSRKIRDVIKENHEGSNAQLFLHPFTDTHLRSEFRDGQLVGGRIEYVRIFAVVAVFILLIAGINYMNLATARSAGRSREIGVRKSIGATQRSLVAQFIGESVLLALVAFVVALLLVVAALPFFAEVTGKHVTLAELDPLMLALFLGVAVVTGVLAGSYPSFYLASFNVVGALRGGAVGRRGDAGLRKGLVVFQFALSTLLIVGTLTVYRQIDYIRSKNLGLERENLVHVQMEGPVLQQSEAFLERLRRQPGIAAATVSSTNPLSIGQSTTDPSWEGKDPESDLLFHIVSADYDFVETMKMEIVAGRGFSRDFGADSVNYVVNEEAARAMGMDDPLGKSLEFWGQEGQIVGVVKDFHMTSLYEAIEPTIIRIDPGNAYLLYARTEPGRTEEALASLEETYRTFNPGYPFEYQFVDEQYEERYRSEQVVGRLANVFAALAVFIACLGLFGLAAFTAEQRTKEIGIRKVLGASVLGLVMLLSRDYVKLVLLAFVLAAPLAYFAMDDWLGKFAYRTSVGAWIFVVAGVAAVAIAVVTVSFQSIRAASANPVQSLRSE